jgi:hypothetical protein
MIAREPFIELTNANWKGNAWTKGTPPKQNPQTNIQDLRGD